jgi:pimeloyl-ACP methyl ester carboxylesterase
MLMQSVMSVVITAAVVYAGLCAWMYVSQRSQIYYPTPETDHRGAQALWLQSETQRIKVWHVSRPGPKALLYFGGNAEDVAGSIDDFAATFPQRSLYLVNYRGYGGSSGKPTESGLAADALTVYGHVRTGHSDIAVMGRSLGSAVAMSLASRRPVSKLVLVTPYDSLASVAKAHVRWLPVGLLLRDRYDSAALAPKVTSPVLAVIAGQDEIIPRASTDALVAAFRPGAVQVKVVPGTTHNTLDLSPEYLESVAAFLRE